MTKLVDGPGSSTLIMPVLPDRLQCRSTVPADRFRYMYFVIMFLGIGTLWPYNMIISVTDYFADKYPDINTSNIIPMILQYPSIFVLFIMIRFGEKASFTSRFTVSLLLIALTLAVIPSVASTAGASWSFPLLACVVLLMGICVSVIQSTSLSFASKFPPIYMQSVMTGQGIAGVCVCCVLLLIKYAMSQTGDSTRGYLLFIYMSAFVPLIALVLYIGGLQSNYSKFILYGDYRRMSSGAIVPTPSPSSKDKDAESLVHQEAAISHRAIIRKIWRNGTLIASVFIATFIMFPGITVSLKASAIDPGWFPLLLITTFNIFDTVGRFATGFTSVPSSTVLWALAWARFLLYPLFVLQKAGTIPGPGGEVLAFAMVALLAVSNGYLASAAMIKTSSYVEKREEEASSAAMAFFLLAGIVLGLNIAVFLHVAVPAYL